VPRIRRRPHRLLRSLVAFLPDRAGLKLLYGLGFAPVAGGDGEGDGGGGGEAAGGGEAGKEAGGSGEAAGDEGGTPEERITAAEKAAAKANQRVRQLEAAERKREEDSSKEQGKWKEHAEKVEQEREAALSELKTVKIAGALVESGKRLGMSNPDLAQTLRVDLADIEPDDADKLDAALGAVLEKYPDLTGKSPAPRPQVQGGVDSGAASSGGTDMNEVFRQGFGRGRAAVG
jgi:hypothetical protein